MPQDIDSEKYEGSHNGDNYIAYTFYLGNTGIQTVNYWYEVVIDDVIKNVDEAVRIMIVLNDDVKVYAKENPLTHEAEKNTEKFYKNEMPVLDNRSNFKPGDVDKITIFIWLEGDDPECVDNILGGEIKMHMEVTEEHIEQDKDTKSNTDDFNRVHDNTGENQYADENRIDKDGE